jgi:ribosomal protein S18 acetylase RimI-like enzyme
MPFSMRQRLSDPCSRGMGRHGKRFFLNIRIQSMISMTERIDPIIIRAPQANDIKLINAYDELPGERRLEFQRGELTVADYEDNKAVGFITMSNEFLNRSLISVLCVSECFRRKGVARALMDYVCRSSRLPCIYLCTEASNRRMIALLVSAGWLEVGHVDEFSFDGERELIFRRGALPCT